MDIRAKAHDVHETVIALRRDLHQNPEPSMEEFRTTDKLAEAMERLGIAYRRLEPTGLVAEIVGGKPGKTVALRADIDALSIGERTGADFASTREGMMHACGHDTHTAMLVGAAEILQGMHEELPGRVRLLFQHAEEIGVGARAVIAQGGMEGVDQVFGMHVLTRYTTGWINATRGAMAPAASRFTIKVKGVTTHGARPNAGVDATVAAAAIVMNLQSIVSRELPPREQVVVTVGQFHSGSRFNIISGEAYLDGTVRCYSRKIYEDMPGIFERIIQNTAAAYRCEAEVDYEQMINVLINDDDAVDLALAAAKQVVSAPELATVGESLMSGSDDFSEYTAICKGAFVNLGVGGEHPNHSEFFTVDESALEAGTAWYAQVALDYLNQA